MLLFLHRVDVIRHMEGQCRSTQEALSWLRCLDIERGARSIFPSLDVCYVCLLSSGGVRKLTTGSVKRFDCMVVDSPARSGIAWCMY
jgi:hypothetical protein